MRTKLTDTQIYNHEYYLAHKGEETFEARRNRNAKSYRSLKKVKAKRNAKLRERWANDEEYRKKICEYQKARRRRLKLVALSKLSKFKKFAKRSTKN